MTARNPLAVRAAVAGLRDEVITRPAFDGDLRAKDAGLRARRREQGDRAESHRTRQEQEHETTCLHGFSLREIDRSYAALSVRATDPGLRTCDTPVYPNCIPSKGGRMERGFASRARAVACVTLALSCFAAVKAVEPAPPDEDVEARARWFAERRRSANGEAPALMRLRSLAQLRANLAAGLLAETDSGDTWVPIGPSPLLDAGRPFTGR